MGRVDGGGVELGWGEMRGGDARVSEDCFVLSFPLNKKRKKGYDRKGCEMKDIDPK